MLTYSIRNSFIFSAIFLIPSTSAIALTQHCITAPKRVYACDNLIYTSVNRGEEKTLVCVCKSDKKAIEGLLAKDDIATQRIIIRKLLAKHQISKSELREVLNQIN